MNDLNRRNTESVFTQLKQMDSMVREQMLRLDQLAGTIVMLQERLTATEQAIGRIRIAQMGRGPTVDGQT